MAKIDIAKSYPQLIHPKIVACLMKMNMKDQDSL